MISFGRWLLILLAVSFTTQGITMAKHDTILGINFTDQCLGRYQVALPSDMKRVKTYYCNKSISLNTYAPDDHDSIGVLRGKQRLEQWQNYVEAERKSHIGSVTQYIIRDITPPLKTIAYYSDDRELNLDPNTSHVFASLFFKDIPEKELGIIINDNGNVFIPRNETQYIAHYKTKLAEIKKHADQVTYMLWPHTHPGVCLDNEFTIVSDKTVGDEYYLLEFYNGKNSRFTFKSSIFSGSISALKQEIKSDLGFLSLFASSKVNVAGRQGRLFVSNDRYSVTARVFRWISTDDQVNSISHSRLEIEGSFDMDDYPELSPMNGTDMIIGILKFLKVRENGMVFN